MKTLRKYISVLAAAAMIGAFVTAPVYALPDETIDETVDVIVEDGEDTEAEDGEVTEIEEPDSGDIDTPVTDTAESGEGDLDEPDLDDPDDPEDTEAPEPDDPTPETTPQTAATQPAPATTIAPDAVTYYPAAEYTAYAMENVNVRSGPGTTYGIIGSVAAPNGVTVKGTNGTWLAIDYYGGIGFVSSGFFTTTAPTTSATTAATSASAAPVVSDQPIASETTLPVVAEVDPQPGIADTITESVPDVEIDDDSPEPAVTTTEKAPAQTTTTNAPAAVSDTADSGNQGGGITGLLIAIGCAVGTFLLVGVVPVVVHSIYHKKMYEY